MAQFTRINEAEMAEILTANDFLQIKVPGTNEDVWSKLVGRNLSLRVYTSVEGLRSRGNGKDSIKVCLVSRMPNGEIRGVGKVKRVHRVLGWVKNLQNRIDLWSELLGPVCSCGCHMIERKSSRGQFWGCSNYPICRQTRN